MKALKGMVRPFVPQSIRHKVRERRIKQEMRIWHDLNLHHELAGLRITVSSWSDWIVYNEIFVERVYDRAIAQVLSDVPMHQMLHVLDLGANVGFFAILFSHLLFERRTP